MTLCLVSPSVLSLGTSGGIISITKEEFLFQKFFTSVKSSTYEWKSLDKEDKHLIIRGPCGLSILCSCVDLNDQVEHKNKTLSFLESLCDGDRSLDEDIPEPQEHSPTFPSGPSIAPPLIPNLTLQVCTLH